ncbi:metallophosphoesterase [candidate division KSB1 bacterium]|nr:metallophosphoesterase [candidate division KSB1 bacterium]
MTERRVFSYESAVSAILLLALAAVSGLPYVAQAWNLSFIERGFIIVNAALALIVLGLIYDVGERLHATGKGIYAAAVFTSLPLCGVAVADPGAAALFSLTAVNALCVWLAIRAQASDSRAGLLLALLLLYMGFVCGFRWEGAAYAPAVILAARSQRALRGGGVLLIAYAGGALLRLAVSESVLPALAYPTLAPSPLLAALTILPWTLWAIPAIRGWNRDLPIALCAAVVILIIAVSSHAPAALTARVLLLSPVVALVSADHFLRAFAARSERSLSASLWPYLLLGCTFALLIAAALPSATGGLKVSVASAITAALLTAGLLATYLLRQPRWSFALLFTCALWFGAVFRHQFERPAPPSSGTMFGWLAGALVLVLSVVAAIAWKRLFGAPIPASVVGESSDITAGGAEFRRYAVNPLTDWSGRIVEFTGRDHDRELRFAVFGDLAGADSVVSTRQRGYFVYRTLVERLRASGAEFAVSLGDMSLSATELQYRRLRQLLRRFPLPLVVTPGNHDLFDGDRLDLRLFHGLFGADQRSFELGRVQFVILNNALGSVSPDQFRWLEQELTAAHAAEFRLVFAHKPLFDPRAGVFYAMEDRADAEQLHALFRQTRVTAVFSGHIHALRVFDRDGIQYVISGGGGSKLVSASERHHYWIATARPGSLSLEALPISSHEVSLAEPLQRFEFRNA